MRLAVSSQTAPPLSAAKINPKRALKTLKSCLETERGVEFETGDSFFRRESSVGRDLGVLSASLQSPLRLLDAMCGCGVRSLRYLSQAGAAFVWANDANEDHGDLIASNLSRAGVDAETGRRRWVVTSSDANRVLVESYLKREFFDFIDVDSFGSDSTFMRSAINALRIGGLLYVTSTDGYSSGGHRPQHSLASYGAYVRPMPYSNEVGLRMLIGGVVREASALGFHVVPLFSYYSYHGPVFRVMLRLNRGKLSENSYYGFITYCTQCGNSHAYSWDKLGQISCPCSGGAVSRSVIVSGPLWTGPLHDGAYVGEMLELAKQWGWACTGSKGTDLDKLLNQLIDESDPLLPFGYIKLDEVSSRAKVNSPPLASMIDALRKEGYAVSRSHIASNAIKTNCPMSVCIETARELQRIVNSENVLV
ncbi:hypothetical protein QJS10_CPB21g01573 [Acorus calamus]|uniref:tRNA (guanine(26)-N(2))-dimethyltransferase n=1 Tax=Acorus calamus TaxID=4465 RepID=A0AAV9C7D5_ACOCL|nr:hypothetical protein QJS10_CPB21g01573 [Acorus calamus]